MSLRLLRPLRRPLSSLRPHIPHTQASLSARTYASDPSSRYTPRAPRNISDPDRGPQSTEDTQTDFGALDVLGAAPAPSSSVDVCISDGFLLDSGLRIADGDGLLIIGGEAFVWRPWMANIDASASASASTSAASRAEESTASTALASNDARGIVTGTSLLRAAFRSSSSSSTSTSTSTSTSSASSSSTSNSPPTPKSKPPTLSQRTANIITPQNQFDLPPSSLGLLRDLWPRPDILIVGTGPRILPLSKATRATLQDLGFRLEVLDTRNAASQFNLLATERGIEEVAGIMVPIGFGEV